MTLDHILQDNNHQHIGKLAKCISFEDLALLCDTKGQDDIQVCKLNEEKVSDWLKTKVVYCTVRSYEHRTVITLFQYFIDHVILMVDLGIELVVCATAF